MYKIINFVLSALLATNIYAVESTKHVMVRIKVGEVVKENIANNKNSNFKKIYIDKTIAVMPNKKAKFASGYEQILPANYVNKKQDVFKSYGIKAKLQPKILEKNIVNLDIDFELNLPISADGFSKSITSNIETNVNIPFGKSLMLGGLVEELNHNNKEIVIAITPLLIEPTETTNIKFPKVK